MTSETRMIRFITDWFQRFDRLDPPEAFLPNLAPDVEWDMPDIDPGLHGHNRFLAWYAGIRDLLEAPTEHRISGIALQGNSVSFTAAVAARTKSGEHLELTAEETWQFRFREDGEPLITHYSAKLLD
jgi:hypothetical protein